MLLTGVERSRPIHEAETVDGRPATCAARRPKENPIELQTAKALYVGRWWRERLAAVHSRQRHRRMDEHRLEQRPRCEVPIALALDAGGEESIAQVLAHQSGAARRDRCRHITAGKLGEAESRRTVRGS